MHKRTADSSRVPTGTTTQRERLGNQTVNRDHRRVHEHSETIDGRCTGSEGHRIDGAKGNGTAAYTSGTDDQPKSQ